MPFELVQKTYLWEEYQQLKEKENRLLEITAEYEEVLDSFSEEDKETEVFNEAKDGFVTTVVFKEVKRIKSEMKKNSTLEEDCYESKIIKVGELITEEKELKVQIKIETEELHMLTKETIEKLSDEQVLELLELKWIKPLVTALYELPQVVINQLAVKVEALAEKYATTYYEVEEQIRETESVLACFIDELEGDEYDMKGLSEFRALLKGE
ncbi:hypothetical protein SDC9_182188 [bioreactor metagenome]|uniref:Uncharacterized protein n=1 Tax=bioreactor metagenome TaxID=1076179 RepID=A0A645HF28_9ZZZZ